MHIGIANAAEVDALWPLIADGMQRGCDRTGGASSSGDLWQIARSGNGFLIVIFDGKKIICSSVWRFENWPGGNVFRCLCLTGSDMKTWIRPLFEFATQRMMEGGARRLVAEGRNGWGRALEKYANVKTRQLWQCIEVM